MPPDPLGSRQQAVTAWTGKEFVVVGGAPVRGNGPAVTTAAAYDPGARTWTSLPNFPLAARTSAASTWTGYGLVVWGGETSPGGVKTPTKALADGAILDVAKRQWHVMPAGPLPALNGPVAVTDAADHVVIMGGATRRPSKDRQRWNAAAEPSGRRL